MHNVVLMWRGTFFNVFGFLVCSLSCRCTGDASRGGQSSSGPDVADKLSKAIEVLRMIRAGSP